MSWRRARLHVLVACLVVLWLPAQTSGQNRWSIDLSAGRIVYTPVADEIGTGHLMGTLRFDTRSGTWVSGTAGVPLQEGDPRWGMVGAGGRVPLGGSASQRLSMGVDLGVNGFLFQDVVANRTGQGATLEAMPFASVAAGAGRLEMLGGWRGHTLDYAGSTESRGVLDGGIRMTYGEAVRVQGDLRWVHAREGTFPFAGGSVAFADGPVQVWAQVGRWMSDTLADGEWGAGMRMALRGGLSVWAAARRIAPDPLYWNLPRRTWNVGLTHQFGGGVPVLRPQPRADDSGTVHIRVTVDEAPNQAPSVAGDFSGWQPLPMHRDDDEWVIQLALDTGVYHYAFRSAQGEWFVPASVASRRDDGMGGHVAVLVVP